MSSINELAEKIHDNITGKDIKPILLDIIMKNNLKNRVDIANYYQSKYEISLFDEIKSKVKSDFGYCAAQLFLSPLDFCIHHLKLGLDKNHPEIFDLVESLGKNKINYNDFVKKLNELMGQKEEDTGLQRMYDLLLFDQKSQNIDRELLKKIGIETGNPLTEFEITYLLNRAGDGRTITLESFIDFMKL